MRKMVHGASCNSKLETAAALRLSYKNIDSLPRASLEFALLNEAYARGDMNNVLHKKNNG